METTQKTLEMGWEMPKTEQKTDKPTSTLATARQLVAYVRLHVQINKAPPNYAQCKEFSNYEMTTAFEIIKELITKLPKEATK